MGSFNMDNLALGLKGADYKALESLFLELDLHLTLRTYLDSYQLGSRDTKIWINIRMSKVAHAMVRKGQFNHVTRWFSYIQAVHPEIQGDVKAAQGQEKDKRAAASRVGGSYNIGLRDTENGVVTRFPPEPSYVTPRITHCRCCC